MAGIGHRTQGHGAAALRPRIHKPAPISVLVARAVRAAYGLTLEDAAPNQSQPETERKAA